MYRTLSFQLSRWKDRRLNQLSPTYLIWVDPCELISNDPRGNLDCGAIRQLQTSNFSCAESNA